MRAEYVHFPPADTVIWTLRKPEHPPAVPYLAILCGDWSYGLLPYCGPGRIDALWESEKKFLEKYSEYLREQGFFTLSLESTGESSTIPPDETLIKVAGFGGLLSALQELTGPSQWHPTRMIGIGHGLGGYVLCQLASSGIRPAAFIFASGIFSDFEVILTQKYLPLADMMSDIKDHPDNPGPDSESLLIAKNFGILLRAIKKGKKNITLNNGKSSLQLQLDPMLFTGTQMPRHMFRHIISPTLLIHGSADYDISLWNVASIEQSIRKNGITPERVILTDRDHWFRKVPKKPGDQFIERINGECFRRETDPRGFQESVSFIKRVVSQEITGQMQNTSGGTS